MKTFFILIACALIDLTLSARRREPGQDCIKFANEQDQDFYEGEFLEYSYAPCNDPEENIRDNPDITCIPLEGNKPLLKNQTCEAGEYKHYHWTIQDYDVINDNKGSSIEFSLTPCHGHPELYIKPQILYAGIPMCQLFETVPGTEGTKTNTWPFPNNLTGTKEQGPDSALFELEKQAKQGTTVTYPGAFFSEQVWGHNGSVTSDDGRPQPHRISIPSISYGGFFVSVYCKTASEFEVGIAAQQKKDADRDRRANRDEDSLAMKVRRFGYDVDDEKMDGTWGSLKDARIEDFLAQERYDCYPTDENYETCASDFYMEHFGLALFSADVITGAHHPETTNRSLKSLISNSTGDFCHIYSESTCEDHCCKWSHEGDSDIADFLKYGPFKELRNDIEINNGTCRPATTKQSLCVTTKKEVHMQNDNEACLNDEDRDTGGCDRRIQATMEVTFYTGETGGHSGESSDTWPLFQLNHVEMNDCVSQLDKVGQEYCYVADYERSIDEGYPTGPTIKAAGTAGYKWSRTCGHTQPGSDDRTCDPNFQTVGKCFWDGIPDSSETAWTNNGDDCVMWTPCGVAKNGLPVMIEHKRGGKETKELIKREIPAEVVRGGKKEEFDVPGSYYIYGHVNDMTRESLTSTPQNIVHNRHVLERADTWLRFPAHTWVRVEVPVLNNVTYFFNILRKASQNSSVESYTGVSAITFFYHKTQMYSDTTIVIIAVVVIVALLFLLIPFIYTKRKIKEHLRKVYEKHKERGQGLEKEEEGEAERGDNVVNYADDDDNNKVVGYTVQDIATISEKQDPSMLKKDSSEPSKGGIIDVE